MKKLTLFVNDDCVCVSVTAYTKKKDLDNIDVHAFAIQDTLQDYILNLENEEKLSQLKQISIGRN